MYKDKKGCETVAAKNTTKSELQKAIGERLREYRHNRGMTQVEVAELLDISLNHYGNVERGEKFLAVDKLVLLYEKMGVDLTYLITGNKRNEYKIKLDDISKVCPVTKAHTLERLVEYAITLSNMDS